jgi:hypothetical protein
MNMSGDLIEASPIRSQDDVSTISARAWTKSETLPHSRWSLSGGPGAGQNDAGQNDEALRILAI